MATFVRIGSADSIAAELAAMAIGAGTLSLSAQQAGVAYLKNLPPLTLGFILAFQITEMGESTTIECLPVRIAFPLPSPIGPGPIVIGGKP